MTNRVKIILGVSAIALLAVGYITGRGFKTYELSMQEKMGKMDHSKTDMEVEHKKESIKTAPNRLDPKVKIVSTRDTMGGYNLRILADAFYWTPQSVGLSADQNTGHAHIYINNVKLSRVYSEWFHVPAEKLKNGTNTVTVSLNANNHATWLTKAGKEVSASVELVK